MLLPPPHLSGLRVFYLERQGPLRSLSTLMEETLAADPGFTFGSAATAERLVTGEGEYAAVIDIQGTLGGAPAAENGDEGEEEHSRPVQRSVGAVFGEDFSTWLDVVCVKPELFDEARALARQLLASEQLCLGVRRRRFFFTPPSGWHPMANGLIARFYPPGYPRESAVVTVWPAQPLESAGIGWHEQVLRGTLHPNEPDADAELGDGPHRLTSAHGLAGLWSRVRVQTTGGQRRRRTVATFQDRLYGYALTCESPESITAERQHQVLLAVANSVQPIPGAQLAGPPAKSSQILKMWGS